MTRLPFEILTVFEASSKAYIIAQLLIPGGNFRLPDAPLLGDVPIERWLEVPRALDSNGEPRADLFAFCLVCASDRGRIIVGETLGLTVTDRAES